MPGCSRLLAASFAIAAAGLGGCGGGHEPHAPLVKLDSIEAGGWPVLSSDPSGLTVRFIERTRFGIGIVLRNRSGRSVTIVDARTLEPVASLVHQVGTRLVPWNPPRCAGGRGCPAFGFLHSSYGAVRPVALTVAPGKGAAVQLNYRLDACGAVPFATRETARTLEVHYRYGNGTMRRQSLPLRSARLLMRMPAPSDCVPRPHSKIAVTGPFASSSDWTIPGSEGDVCRTTADGALIFLSRRFLSPGEPAVRVAIRLSRFRGLGLYRTLTRPALALGPAQVRVVVGIGIHGWTTFRPRMSVVTVTRQRSKTALGGRFHAVLIGRRHVEFRAYGAWRCVKE